MTSNNTGEKAGPSHGAEVASLELPTPPATTDERTTSPSPSHAADIATPKSASLASPSGIVGIDLNTIGKGAAVVGSIRLPLS